MMLPSEMTTRPPRRAQEAKEYSQDDSYEAADPEFQAEFDWVHSVFGNVRSC